MSCIFACIEPYSSMQRLCIPNDKLAAIADGVDLDDRSDCIVARCTKGDALFLLEAVVDTYIPSLAF